MNKLVAYKMDGLGNDFIIFDKRKKSVSLTKEQIIKISDRNSIGCDQVIFIEKDENSNAFLKFYNSDGGEISACGNGSRCVAYLLMKENNNKKISLGTKVGILQAELNDKNLVSINMGEPNFEWNKIPLSKKMDTQNLKIKINGIDGKEARGGFSLSIGNPHVIFFVEDFNQFNLKEIGPKIENYSYFPEKCNVTLASIKNKNHVKVKVWERGVGLTKACGTAACATAVSGAVLKLSERCVDIEFVEGLLNIDWKKDNNIYMTGKVSEVKKITVNI
jgi:diaminopimelate epimerase|uniref:Diaminopimelate epimerase n=1 Tax=uncultured marine bacterium HF4000_APKG2098 TaxID=455614 RepID=B3TCQ1_9BACT|nr:putative diaminopimelate epimerase [uncultured marine bacterium HF4000_APKG2098]